MKAFPQLGVIVGSMVLTLNSCQVQDDSIGIDIKSETLEEKNSALTCEDLLNGAEDFEGQTIELNAINWGASPSADGEEILMSIDDELLEGLQQAHILAHFSKDQQEEIENFKENDSISLTATVGTMEYGALRLLEAKVAAK